MFRMLKFACTNQLCIQEYREYLIVFSTGEPYNYQMTVYIHDDSPISVFLLSPQIPAQLYDAILRNLVQTDPDAVDQLLKRKCIEQG